MTMVPSSGSPEPDIRAPMGESRRGVADRAKFNLDQGVTGNLAPTLRIAGGYAQSFLPPPDCVKEELPRGRLSI